MSFGSAFGALVSLKNNRRNHSGRTEKHLTGKESISGVKSHRTPSPEELQQIRNRLQLENKKRQQKLYAVAIFLLLLFVAFFSFFMF
ncbi:hypothetical protein [Salinimicrobium soli]|uniref:hypothetical protein n=1 Tax=Salinimicrobium soli TaxID=1254399 RepID=UPI003AAF3D9D